LAAALALPETMRQQYAQHLSALSPDNSQSLLITLEYCATDVTGPPFSVDSREVERLFSKHWEITELGSCKEDIRGKKAIERSYCLNKK
jgi:thiopurine S-methyltransferase